MEINVIDILECDDGGAVMTIEADSEAMKFLASEGLLALLKKEMDNVGKYNPPTSKDPLQTDLEEFTGQGALR